MLKYTKCLITLFLAINPLIIRHPEKQEMLSPVCGHRTDLSFPPDVIYAWVRPLVKHATNPQQYVGYKLLVFILTVMTFGLEAVKIDKQLS